MSNYQLNIAIIVAGFPPIIKGGAENQAKLLFEAFNKIARCDAFTLNFKGKKPPTDGIFYLGSGSGLTLILLGVFHLFFVLKRTYSIYYIHQLNLFSFLAVLIAPRNKIYVKLSNSGEKFDMRNLFGESKIGLVKKTLEYKGVRLISINPAITYDLEKLGYSSYVEINNAVQTVNIPKLSDSDLELVVVSRFKRQKNFEFLEELQKEGIKNKIRIYGGDGDHKQYVESLEQKFENISIEPQFKTKSQPYNSKRSILIHPSHVEGTSNSILEALALGIPVICNDIAANQIFSLNGSGASVIHCSDVLAWANEIKRLETDLDYYNLKSNEAKSFIEKNYSIDHIVKDYFREFTNKVNNA